MNPTLALPRLARGIDRSENAAPSSLRDGPGLDAARADCRKLRGPARDMCYKALALAKRP
ncbi:hypothetical protein AB0M80_21530 [Amycolatopsis sp. NPDC051045]|uniref:hypothetical protein n=1 Tax=Amycolatopsis sp. NPDC051045 TaxID=3156922 RepID=UPI003416656F